MKGISDTVTRSGMRRKENARDRHLQRAHPRIRLLRSVQRRIRDIKHRDNEQLAIYDRFGSVPFGFQTEGGAAEHASLVHLSAADTSGL